MSITMLLIITALVIFSISEILFAVQFNALRERIDDLKNKEELFTEYMKINNKAVENIYKALQKEYELVDTMVKCTNSYSEQYHTINDTCLKIYESYGVITDHYKKLLDTWAKIDERYDQTYEQFKESIKTLKFIEQDIKDYSHDILVGVADGFDDQTNDLKEYIETLIFEDVEDYPEDEGVEIKQTEENWANLSQEEKKEFSQDLLKGL